MTGIPVTGSHVNVAGLHPRFRQRLEAFFADPRIKGKVAVVSGVRTYEQQKYLYAKYKSGRGNLAANPDRRLSSGFQGSYHMGQPAFDGYGYAVDFRIIKKGSITTGTVNKIAAEYGMVKTVRSEWWHHQPCRISNGKLDWFPYSAGKETAHAKTTNNELKQVAELVADCAKQTVRQGDRGIVVRVLQQILVSNGYSLTSKPKIRGGIDGVFGSRTGAAVKKFQRDEQLVVDGVVGPQTWSRLLD